jgi:hypothetical protein
MRARKAAALMMLSASRPTPNAPIATNPSFPTAFARAAASIRGAKSLKQRPNKSLRIIYKRDNLSEWSPLQ